VPAARPQSGLRSSPQGDVRSEMSHEDRKDTKQRRHWGFARSAYARGEPPRTPRAPSRGASGYARPEVVESAAVQTGHMGNSSDGCARSPRAHAMTGEARPILLLRGLPVFVAPLWHPHTGEARPPSAWRSWRAWRLPSGSLRGPAVAAPGHRRLAAPRHDGFGSINVACLILSRRNWRSLPVSRSVQLSSVIWRSNTRLRIRTRRGVSSHAFFS